MKQKITNAGYKYICYTGSEIFGWDQNVCDRGQKANFSSEELSFVQSKITFITIIWQCLDF